MNAWTFAAEAWQSPGVEAIALWLQDVHGQPPALLLWRLWTLENGGGVDEPTVIRAVEIARAWERELLHPLRGVRRRLKSSAGLSAGFTAVADAPELREQILAAELAAERVLLAALESLAGDRRGPPEEPLSALVTLSEIWGPPPPLPQLRRLAELICAAAPSLLVEPVPTSEAGALEFRPSPSL
jgi:uncharacterized protein (TIGR02444 family)